MIELCRHAFLDGRFCRGAAIKGTFFCRHHDSVRKTLTQPRRAATSGMHQLLPFAYPEDRKAILLNLFLVQNALNEGSIDPRRANALTNTMRAQMINLDKIEKAEARQTHIQTGSEETRLAAQPAIHQIYQMVLTSEGEEIAPARPTPEDEEINTAPEDAAPEPASQSTNIVIPSEAEGPTNPADPSETTSAADSQPAAESEADAERRHCEWQQSPQGQSFKRMHRQLNPHLYPGATTLSPEESPSALSY
jgi:hypothetical protein